MDQPDSNQPPRKHLGRRVRDIARELAGLVARQWRIALLIAIVLGLAEIGLRRWAPEFANRVYTRTVTGGHPIEMNADGYRGPVVERKKPEGMFRILALGDSVTFGTGVATDATWPLQLAALERSARDGAVDVLNTGLPAMDLRQMTLMLDEQWAGYKPDVVVVMLTGNVVSLAWTRRSEDVAAPDNPWLDARGRAEATGPKARLKAFAQSFALPGALSLNVERLAYQVGLLDHRIDASAPYGVMLAHGWRQGDLDAGTAELAWMRVESQLSELASRVSDAGVPLIVTYAPPRFSLSDAFLDNLKAVPRNRLTIDPVDRTREICERLGLAFVDLRPALREGVIGRHYVLADYTHFSAAGNAAVASAIAGAITERATPDPG